MSNLTYSYLLILPLLLGTVTFALGQDTTIFRDKQGKKIGYKVRNSYREGYKSISVQTRARLDDYNIPNDLPADTAFAEFGRKVIDEYAHVLGLDPGRTRLAYMSTDSNRQIVYNQTYGGIDVYRAEIRILTRGSRAFKIDAIIIPAIACDTIPLISKEKALEIAGANKQSHDLVLQTPNLVILPLQHGEFKGVHMAWQVRTNSQSDYTYFISAINGSLLWTYYTVE